jgi:hypothetical protein
MKTKLYYPLLNEWKIKEFLEYIDKLIIFQKNKQNI